MIHLLASMWSAATEVKETRIVVLGRSGHGKTALFERLKLLIANPASSGNEQRRAAAAAAEAAAATAAAASSSSAVSATNSPAPDKSLNGLDALRAHVQRQQEQARAAAAAAAAASASASGDGSGSASVEEQRRRKQAEDNDKKYRFATPLPRFMTPTVGLNVGRGLCSITTNDHTTLKTNALLWDVGGDPALRALWQTYLLRAHGVIFVIDLSAGDREITDSVKLLHSLMLRPELAYAPFLVVGTKLDAVKKQEDVHFALGSGAAANAVVVHSSASSSTHPHHALHAPPLSDGERAFLNAKEVAFMRSLRLEDVALRAMALSEQQRAAAARKKKQQQQQQQAATAKTNGSKAVSAPPKRAATAAAAADAGTEEEHTALTQPPTNGGDSNAEDDDDCVDDDTLIAMEAFEAVHCVPESIGGLSGVAGHMYRAIVASAETIDGNDLLESLQWVLSVAASSKSRATALDALNPDK